MPTSIPFTRRINQSTAGLISFCSRVPSFFAQSFAGFILDPQKYMKIEVFQADKNKSKILSERYK